MSDHRFGRRGLFSLRGLGAALGGVPLPRPASPLMSLLAGAPAARSAAPARSVPVVRPPGAVDEADFLLRCTRCTACAEACPHDAIVRAPLRLREAAGTPTIEARSAPCRMCPDVPCAVACPTGALRVDAPRVMGRAVIGAHDCLAFQSSTCSVCVERCPVPGALRLEHGRPVVDTSLCTGCGVCEHVCPSPQNAVIILPALRRGAPS